MKADPKGVAGCLLYVVVWIILIASPIAIAYIYGADDPDAVVRKINQERMCKGGQ